MNPNKRVLIVDYAEIARKSLALMLGKQGYQTETAQTSQEALEKAREGPFNLAILDIELPDTDGVDLLAALKDAQPDMLVIMMTTARVSLTTIVRALNEGASAYIIKPLNTDEVLATVREVLEKQRLVSENRRLYQAAQQELAERTRIEKELRQRNRELALLNRAGQAFNSSLDLDRVLTNVLEELRRLMGVVAFSVWLADPDNGDLICRQATGPRSEKVIGWRLTSGEGIAGWVATHGQSVIVSDAQEDERHFSGVNQQTGLSLRSMVSVPLKVKEHTIGVLQVVDEQARRFDKSHLTLLELIASSAARAIENARLYEQAQQEIAERERAEAALAAERAMLAQRVAERTAELSAANAELARAARLKDEFLANMSHELRTPLNAILGMSEVLKRELHGPLNERQHKYLSTVEESGRHLLALINDILDISKIEAGKIDLQIVGLSVRSACQASLQLIKQQAHRKQIKLSASFDEQVTTLQADKRRLKQILVNLLSNAVKFTPPGGEIGLEVVGAPARQAVGITVWDTGIGVPADDMERLFKPFVQLDSSLARQYVGTGLGLALVYRLTEAHGGSVSVESTPGQGSRFTISLPWQPQGQVPQAQETKSHQVEPARQPGQSAQIVLLAEDNQASIDTLSAYLSAGGYQTIVARNGEEAIERARKTRPDIILMDIQMPGVDGLEATRRIRADADLSHIPIVALTALAMPGDRDRCLSAGANAYLSKPVNLKELSGVIEEHLPHSKS